MFRLFRGEGTLNVEQRAQGVSRALSEVVESSTAELLGRVGLLLDHFDRSEVDQLERAHFQCDGRHGRAFASGSRT